MSNRTQILRKPGHVVFDGVTFFSSAPIVVELMEETVELTSQNFGKFDERPIGRMVSIKFTPQLFNADALAKLFPFGALAMGSSIIATTDKPLDIHCSGDERYRIPCAFVYKEPVMTWGPGQPILGEVEFRGIVGISADPGALASYFAQSSTAYPGNTAWDEGDVITPNCTYSWSSGSASLWDDLDMAAPPAITTEAELVEDKAEGRGLINVAITNYKVTMTAEPMNLTPALVLAALGFGSPLGSSKAALGRDFKINATGAYGRLFNAVLKAPSSLRYSSNDRVISPLTWEAQATFTTGTKQPLFSISTTDPDA